LLFGISSHNKRKFLEANRSILGLYKDNCYAFAWQGFGSGGAIGVASVRSCKKLHLCLIKPVPASSKPDALLPKAKPISDGGSASVITYLRKGRKNSAVKRLGRERSETI